MNALNLLNEYKALRGQINGANDEEAAKNVIEGILELSGKVEKISKSGSTTSVSAGSTPLGSSGSSSANLTSSLSASTSELTTKKESIENLQDNVDADVDVGDKDFNKHKNNMIDFATKLVKEVIESVGNYDETKDYTLSNNQFLPDYIRDAFLLLFYRSFELKKINEFPYPGKSDEIVRYINKRDVNKINNLDKTNYKTINYSIVFPEYIKKIIDEIVKTTNSFIKLVVFYNNIKLSIQKEYENEFKRAPTSENTERFKTEFNIKEKRIRSTFGKIKISYVCTIDEIDLLIKKMYFILNKTILYLKFLLETTNIILIRRYNLFREIKGKENKIFQYNEKRITSEISDELKKYSSFFENMDGKIEDPERKKQMDDIKNIQDKIDKLFNPVDLKDFSILKEVSISKYGPFYQEKLDNNYKNFKTIQESIISDDLFTDEFKYDSIIPDIPETNVLETDETKKFKQTFSKRMLYNLIEKNIMFKNSDFLNGKDIDFNKFYNSSSSVLTSSSSMPTGIKNIFTRLYYINLELKSINNITIEDTIKNKLKFITNEIVNNFLITEVSNFEGYNIDIQKPTDKNYKPYKNNFTRKGGFSIKKTRKFKKIKRLTR